MPDQSTYTHLEELGLEEEQLGLVKQHAGRPSGMVMSVGPVGSGKSTTMYSCLTLLNDPHKSIATIEDPVERRIAGINQIQAEPKINFGVVEALRGVLRQDPNILMIGEIRDPETAHIGCRAALTGVMVLCTMHANDCTSTIDVFREFGIPPMFIADSVNCIISQRLIRKVCPVSRESYNPDAGVCQMLGLDPANSENTFLVRGIPSDENFHTGYSGRTGIFEVMVISKAIREAILKGRSSMEIREIAQSEGMMTLEQAMRKKVLRQETSVEELHRVISTYGL
jgi:type II secretory ATPase GspE/PulE/Tfp pilus assembly ATPase PilB-like protein